MEVKFITAHVDDAPLAASGLIIRLVSEGHNVEVVSLSHIYGGHDLSEEFNTSMNVLGATGKLYNVETRRFDSHKNYVSELIYSETRKPKMIVTHDILDRHPDHRIVAEQVLRVFNNNLYTFIAPWNGEERPTFFSSLNGEMMTKKIEVLRCFKSQNRRQYMQSQEIISQLVYNAQKCSKLYAEGFKVVRLIQ